ncbi:MAG: DUF4192 domain-containing protein, partial [Actinomycetes bacterium]
KIPDVVDRPILRASGPADIVQLVPYLLGFHPNDSVVLIAMRGRRIVVSVRNDLDAPIELVVPLCITATRAGADRVVALLYADGISGPPLPRQRYVDELRALFAEHGLEEVDIIAVSDGRWWSYRCSDPRCCAPDGTPIETSGVTAATAVAEGLVALPNRESLESELALDELAMNVVRSEIAEFIASEYGKPEESERQIRAGDWAEVRKFVKKVRKGDSFTPKEAARVLCALEDRSVRDATIGYLVSRPDPDVREAWRRLTTVAPTRWRPAPATLYAMWCYADGNGARTNVGVDVALDADPDYAMAQILLELQMSALNPFEFLHDMAVEAERVGRRIQRKRHPSGRQAATRSAKK